VHPPPPPRGGLALSPSPLTRSPAPPPLCRHRRGRGTCGRSRRLWMRCARPCPSTPPCAPPRPAPPLRAPPRRLLLPACPYLLATHRTVRAGAHRFTTVRAGVAGDVGARVPACSAPPKDTMGARHPHPRRHPRPRQPAWHVAAASGCGAARSARFLRIRLIRCISQADTRLICCISQADTWLICCISQADTRLIHFECCISLING
jgi:hypothetical protein